MTRLIQSCGFTQHVKGATHTRGHMLDIVMSRPEDKIVRAVSISSPISDHYSLHCRLDLRKVHLPQRTTSYRQFKSMDIDSFRSDLSKLPIVTGTPDTLDTLLYQYDTQITALLEKHAPLKSKTVTVRPYTPWFNEDVYSLKKQRRKAEHHWRKSGLEVHRQIYCNLRDKFNACVKEAKVAFFNEKVTACGSDQKALFRVVNQLLGKNNEVKLPSYDTVEEVLEKFGNFFTSKITKIREDLDSQPLPTKPIIPLGAFSTASLTSFKPVSSEDIIKLVKKAPTKSCSLDPIPTWLLKEVLPTLAPVISTCVNLSLKSGYFPPSMKQALSLLF